MTPQEAIAVWELTGTLTELARRMARLDGAEMTHENVEKYRRNLQRWKTGTRLRGRSLNLFAKAAGLNPEDLLDPAGEMERRLARLEIAVARIEDEISQLDAAQGRPDVRPLGHR